MNAVDRASIEQLIVKEGLAKVLDEVARACWQFEQEITHEKRDAWIARKWGCASSAIAEMATTAVIRSPHF